MSDSDRYVDPTREQFDYFKTLDRESPIMMLNLIRYKDTASYPEDHPCAGENLTGEQAYKNYMRESGAVFERLGGEIMWKGAYKAMVIGPDDKQWDQIFVARYPSANAFMAMISDPDYQKAVVHRQAAVLTSRLMRLE